MVLELSLELGNRQLHLARDRFAAELEFPSLGIDTGSDRRNAVVAHEQVLSGRHAIVEQVRGCLGVERPVVENRQSLFAGDFERLVALRERRRDQAGRHQVRKRNRGAERRRHRGETTSRQESAPRYRIAPPAPDGLIGPERVGAVEFMNTTSFVCHESLPLLRVPFSIVRPQ